MDEAIITNIRAGIVYSHVINKLVKFIATQTPIGNVDFYWP
jgi:hypothetical protein